jgi:hypothetical protein
MKKVFFIFLMFGTIKNLGQTKNIFGWPKKPHLRSVKWFFFFFVNNFSSLSFYFLHVLSIVVHFPLMLEVAIIRYQNFWEVRDRC